MFDKRGVHMTVELKPNLFSYAASWGALGVPLIFWIIGDKIPVNLLGICVAGAFLDTLYKKNMTVRLDEVGISQGIAMLRTFMEYGTVAAVHREVRLLRGRPTAVLIILQQNSSKRIVIRVRFFDQVKVAQTMGVLAQRAPRAQIEDALYVQFNPSSEWSFAITSDSATFREVRLSGVDLTSPRIEWVCPLKFVTWDNGSA
jgi:hypothetical protein